MNLDRLLREVEGRLAGLDEAHRNEVLDALREEIARERRRVEPELTVEAERRRRVEAEMLREVAEAINRPAALDEIMGEVQKQLTRLIPCDSSVIALLEGDGRFRVLAARGAAEETELVGRRFQDALTDQIRDSRWPLHVADVEADSRFAGRNGLPPVRSWCGMPLLVEGEVIGILSLGRARVEPFEDEDLHAAKAVAFSAAAIRRAQLHDKVRRYALLMEQLVAVDQAVFGGADAARVAETVLAGAGHIGNYRGGLFVMARAKGPEVVATIGDGLGPALGRTAPAGLDAGQAARIPVERFSELAGPLGLTAAPQEVLLVPVTTGEARVGTLALLDPDGETAEDRLMESYASRAATACLFVLRGGA
jgi:GAF domain-containing protein